MQYYDLQNDEVILYHSPISIITNGKANNSKNISTELLLTNLNFVFITITKRFLGKEKIEKEIFCADSVKFYKNEPHIIKNDKIAEIYFLEGEKFVEFANKKEATKFCDAAKRLVSKQSKFVRAVKKVQNEIKETNEALNIDLVEITKNVVDVAATVAIEAAKSSTAGKTVKSVGLVSKIFKDRKKKDALPLESEEP